MTASGIHGRVHCKLFGAETTLELTESGWRAAGDPALARAFDLLANPADFGPGDGDPMAGALARLAGILDGTYEVTPLPAPPPGTISRPRPSPKEPRR